MKILKRLRDLKLLEDTLQGLEARKTANRRIGLISTILYLALILASIIHIGTWVWRMESSPAATFGMRAIGAVSYILFLCQAIGCFRLLFNLTVKDPPLHFLREVTFGLMADAYFEILLATIFSFIVFPGQAVDQQMIDHYDESSKVQRWFWLFIPSLYAKYFYFRIGCAVLCYSCTDNFVRHSVWKEMRMRELMDEESIRSPPYSPTVYIDNEDKSRSPKSPDEDGFDEIPLHGHRVPNRRVQELSRWPDVSPATTSTTSGTTSPSASSPDSPVTAFFQPKGQPPLTHMSISQLTEFADERLNDPITGRMPLFTSMRTPSSLMSRFASSPSEGSQKSADERPASKVDLQRVVTSIPAVVRDQLMRRATYEPIETQSPVRSDDQSISPQSGTLAPPATPDVSPAEDSSPVTHVADKQSEPLISAAPTPQSEVPSDPKTGTSDQTPRQEPVTTPAVDQGTSLAVDLVTTRAEDAAKSQSAGTSADPPVPLIGPVNQKSDDRSTASDSDAADGLPISTLEDGEEDERQKGPTTGSDGHADKKEEK